MAQYLQQLIPSSLATSKHDLMQDA